MMVTLPAKWDPLGFRFKLVLACAVWGVATVTATTLMTLGVRTESILPVAFVTAMLVTVGVLHRRHLRLDIERAYRSGKNAGESERSLWDYSRLRDELRKRHMADAMERSRFFREVNDRLEALDGIVRGIEIIADRWEAQIRALNVPDAQFEQLLQSLREWRKYRDGVLKERKRITDFPEPKEGQGDDAG